MTRTATAGLNRRWVRAEEGNCELRQATSRLVSPDAGAWRAGPGGVVAEIAAEGMAASEDWRVQDDEKRHDEAERLMLARLIAAPDAWRGRASAAGGFLGTAAVVAFWGLTSNAKGLSTSVTVVAGIASFFYVCSVILFLTASVWPPPHAPDEETTDYFGTTKTYVRKEAKKIRCAVRLGAVAASCALVLTAVCSFLLLRTGHDIEVMVSVQDPDDRAAIERLCPGIADPFEGSIPSQAEGNIVDVKIEGDTCGGARVALSLPRDSISVLEKSNK